MKRMPPQICVGVLMAMLISIPSVAEERSAYKVERGPIRDENNLTTYYLSSDYLEGESRIQILRPDEPTDRILFLLPVTPWPGFEEKWERLGSGMNEIVKHDLHNRFGYTVIVPDFPEHMPWFVDHQHDTARQHESYMMRVVIPFVDSLRPIENPTRDLAGFSKGGFGSLSLLLRHPNVFHAAAAWDPGGVTKPYNAEDIGSLSDAAGSADRFEAYQLGASIEANAPDFRGAARIAISGSSNEKFLAQLQALREMLLENQIPHLYSETVQVPHRWYTGWLEQSLQSLQQMGE